MPGILSQSSALLVSLARDPIMSQTVPSKVQAYLAAGKPIIAALDGEGARVVMEAGAGVACPAEAAQALADAVLQLRDALPQERQRMAQCGRSYYEQHFEPTLLAKRLAEILSGMVIGRPNAGTDTKNA
jgi:glycosyltransferase involved in cell wall biosynthesis